MEITRRNFANLTLAFSTAQLPLHAATLDRSLSASVQRHGIPAAAAIVANSGSTLYHGAFGHRDSESGTLVTTQSIFRIASMTKAITAVSAMQLVERGKLKLDEPSPGIYPHWRNWR